MTYCIRLQFPLTAKNCPKLRGVFLFHYHHPPPPKKSFSLSLPPPPPPSVLKCNLQQVKLLTIDDSTLAPINKQLLSDFWFHILKWGFLHIDHHPHPLCTNGGWWWSMSKISFQFAHWPPPPPPPLCTDRGGVVVVIEQFPILKWDFAHWPPPPPPTPKM